MRPGAETRGVEADDIKIFQGRVIDSSRYVGIFKEIFQGKRFYVIKIFQGMGIVSVYVGLIKDISR